MLTFRNTLVMFLAAVALPASAAVAQDVTGEGVVPEATASPANADDASKLEFFEKEVRPVLVGKCYTCHSAETKPSGGLRVDDRHGLLEGGSSGAAVVPGAPDESLLVQAIEYSSGMDMPPEQKLSDEEIAVLRQWIADGAVWPAEDVPVIAERNDEKYAELRANHWAYRPISKPPVPVDRENSDWAKTDVDRFIQQKLEEQGLQPTEDADEVTLLRRVTFDLTGLSPEAKDVEAFLADDSGAAFERVVDRLLASPAFGERWGRHWLDVARYGESTGSARNIPYPEAWRYRDYVIASFNEDKPFDLFVKEQIAGDLLPSQSDVQRDERQIATGFLAIGVKDVNQRFKVRFVMDNVDEQIDTVSRAFMGLTVSCARCHDHKFDPIPATDYYALAGIFRSTDLCAGVRNKMGGGGLDYYDEEMLLTLTTVPGVDVDPAAIETAERAVEETKAAFEKLKDSPEGEEKAPNGRPKRQVANNKMKAAQATLEALLAKKDRGAVAIGVREGAEISDTELRIRGEAARLGPVVPRGFLSTFDVPDAPAIDPSTSGRRELAEWIASSQNPLTARVAVNRIWSRLFGSGLVRTVDNFGVTGDVPSHPELLDWLAATFIEEGQSTKSLIRRLALSRTYRLSSAAHAAGIESDPDNRWLWRHSPRRLDAEEIRDAMLAASGNLDTCQAVGSPVGSLEVREINDDGPEAGRVIASAVSTDHRSVYLPLLRRVTPTPLAVFDFAEQGMVTGHRDETTVPSQALYLLNDPFVRKQSERLTDRLLAREAATSREIAALAYELAWGRKPTAEELSAAEAFLEQYRIDVQASLARHSMAGDSAADENPDSVAAMGIESTVSATEPQPAAESHAKREAVAAFAQALFGAAEFRYLR